MKEVRRSLWSVPASASISGEVVAMRRGELFPTGWGRCWERVEAVAGLWTVLLLGLLPVLPLAIGVMQALHTDHPGWALFPAAAMFLVIGLAVLLGAMAGQAVRVCFPEWSVDPASRVHWREDGQERREPSRSFAVETALMLPEFPVLVRPILAIWWLLHFAGLAGLAMVLHELVGVSFPETIPGVLLALLVHMAFLIGSNLYLVLAASMWNHRVEALEQVWNARYWIDLALTALVVLYCL